MTVCNGHRDVFGKTCTVSVTRGTVSQPMSACTQKEWYGQEHTRSQSVVTNRFKCNIKKST